MAQAETIPNTTRRVFLSGAVAAAVLPAAAAPQLIDPIKQMADEFEAAVAAFDRFYLLNQDTESDRTISAERDRLFEAVSSKAKRIAGMKAATLDGLRLKARALMWCNEELDFMDGNTTDERLARGIVHDLLSLQAS